MIVGERIHIRGTVEGDEDLVVRGRLEGTVRVSGTVTIEEGGWVAAEVFAREAIVCGAIIGNITATSRIEVTRSGRMVGDATAPAVTIVAGAAFKGRVEMGEVGTMEAPPQLPAIDRRASPREIAPPPPRPARPTLPPPAAARPAATTRPTQRPPLAQPRRGALQRR